MTTIVVKFKNCLIYFIIEQPSSSEYVWDKIGADMRTDITDDN